MRLELIVDLLKNRIMKKFFFLTVFLMVTGFSFSQKIHLATQDAKDLFKLEVKGSPIPSYSAYQVKKITFMKELNKPGFFQANQIPGLLKKLVSEKGADSKLSRKSTVGNTFPTILPNGNLITVYLTLFKGKWFVNVASTTQEDVLTAETIIFSPATLNGEIFAKL